MMRTPQLSVSHAHAGKTIREMLEDNLTEAMRRYIEMKEVPLPDEWNNGGHISDNWIKAERLLAMQRGVVRGAAQAVLTWRNCYYKDRIRKIKEIEKEFSERIRNDPSSNRTG